VKVCFYYKYYCSIVHFRRITSIYQPTNAHIISHKTLLKHFKTLRHVSILSNHHQGTLFLAKLILRYSQFNSYLQTRCCGSISCCVGKCCEAVVRCASYDALSQWLRCCATNRKVAGSIPAGVSGFFIDIKSFRSHYGALGSTHPLTEMSTRSNSWG